MDFLKSLNVEDLPEQQTRTSHLLGRYPDFNLKLGFDACCTCGKPSPKVRCDGCRRVKYCSNECRYKDSIPLTESEAEEDDRAMGHSSVVCAILSICNDDEDVMDESSSQSLDGPRKDAATDRLASEYESYPATLANVISGAPCYQDVLHKRSGGSLIIHIVGASSDGELWVGHPDHSQERQRFHCYADALAEMAANFKLKSIILQFFGPECPTVNLRESVEIPNVKGRKDVATLHVLTFKCDYCCKLLDGEVDSAVSAPDILVFFNPGFTCPDYNWEEAVTVLRRRQLPFLVTTNTEMEGFADLQYLSDRNLIQDVPPGLSDIVQNSDETRNDANDNVNDDNDSFFDINPFCGLRVRQSGTMANDLYVKNRWILGGLSGPSQSFQEKGSTKSALSHPQKKKRRVDGSGNTKQENPALV